jgi:hypothetical protein
MSSRQVALSCRLLTKYQRYQVETAASSISRNPCWSQLEEKMELS